jgi:hypothetical protein
MGQFSSQSQLSQLLLLSGLIAGAHLISFALTLLNICAISSSKRDIIGEGLASILQEWDFPRAWVPLDHQNLHADVAENLSRKIVSPLLVP